MNPATHGVLAALVLCGAGSAFGQVSGGLTRQIGPDGVAVVGDGAAGARDGEARVIEYIGSGQIGPGEGFGTRAADGLFMNPGTPPEADGHSGAVFTADGTKVIVANRESNNLTVFDIATRALVMEIPLSGDPESLALSSDGVTLVTANMHTASASIVNLTTGTETAVVPVGTYPTRARITPDGLTAVVNCTGSPTTLYVIDIATASVLRTIPSGGVLQTLSFNPETFAMGFSSRGHVIADNATALIPDYNNSRVKVIDITTGAVTNVATDANPADIAVAGNTALVTHFLSVRKVTVIDIPSRTVVKTIPVTTDLWGPISVNPAGTRAVVAVQNNCRVIDIASSVVSGDLATASVSDLATTFDGQYAVCAGFRGSIISYATQTLVKDTNNFVSTPMVAVSPVSHRAALFSDTFGEDMVIVDTNGAAGGLLSGAPTGPAPEADSCRTAAISPDGSKVITVNQRSQTAVVFDSHTRQKLATINTGRRPGAVEITPDGSKAVFSNKDGTDATVVDLNTYATTSVPISFRGDEIEISPDGQFAYVAVVASGDGVWRINLTTNTVQGAKLTTGDMGGVGYSYSQTSGMRLSPGGGTLVTCNSFNNSISIIDTGAWAVVKTVAVGTFPTRATFSPDGTRIYITNRDSDSISVVSNAGAASAVIGTIAVGDFPYETAVSPDGSTLYVINFNPKTVGVVNTATLVQTSTVPFPAATALVGLGMSPDGTRLYVANGNASVTFGLGGFTRSQFGTFSVVETAGNTIVQNADILYSPATLVLNTTGAAGAVPQPNADGVTLVRTCRADFNFDGFLDGIDYDEFNNAFEAGDPSADYNGDGFIDGIDSDEFNNDFEAGC